MEKGENVMKAAIVAKWTTPVPGRETAAVAYAREADDFWGKKAAEGLCTEPRWLWAPAGENLWVVEGEYEALLSIFALPESQKLLTKGTLLVQDFGYGLYMTGSEEVLGPYEEILTELQIH